jgi:hypothetical protein
VIELIPLTLEVDNIQPLEHFFFLSFFYLLRVAERLTLITIPMPDFINIPVYLGEYIRKYWHSHSDSLPNKALADSIFTLSSINSKVSILYFCAIFDIFLNYVKIKVK